MDTCWPSYKKLLVRRKVYSLICSWVILLKRRREGGRGEGIFLDSLRTKLSIPKTSTTAIFSDSKLCLRCPEF